MYENALHVQKNNKKAYEYYVDAYNNDYDYSKNNNYEFIKVCAEFKKENKELKDNNKKLQETITELELRPPPEGGALYQSAHSDFVTLSQSTEITNTVTENTDNIGTTTDNTSVSST